MNRLPVVLSVLVALHAAAAFAHHGVAAYDMKVVQTVEGVVEAWGWQNPHTSLTLRVMHDGGESRSFPIEGAPPRWMQGQGWTPESLAAGERVLVTYHPARSVDSQFAAILMEVRRENGEVLKVNRPAYLGGP
jgi:hypothetical protein